MEHFLLILLSSVVIVMGIPQPILPDGRVVGGSQAKMLDAPYIVSLQWINTETETIHFCGGTIVASQWVLTAAHCVSGIPHENHMIILAGKYDLSKEESHEQRRYVENYVLHENFTGGIAPNDIALLYVTEPFVWTEYVQYIELPEPNVIFSGDSEIFGWGSTSTDYDPKFPHQLHHAVLPIVEYELCEIALGGEGATPLTTTNLCTGPLEGGTSACNGDSGGPLINRSPRGNQILVGVVSWGFYPCGGFRAPSIYVRVSAFVSWINNIINA